MRVYVDVATEVETLKCWACGLWFGVDAEWLGRRRASGQSFVCPNGCCIKFGESDAERLKKEIVAKQARIDGLETNLAGVRSQRDAAERSARAERGHVTRLKRRAAHGVCAFCHRTFRNVADHVAEKHPGERASG